MKKISMVLTLLSYFFLNIFSTTYTIVGDNADIFGTDNWNQTVEARDMVEGPTGTWTWSKENVTLSAGNIEYKVAHDHAWTVAFPQNGNAKYNIPANGIYNITFAYTPSAATDEEKLIVTATKVGTSDEPEPEKIYTVVGGHDWLGSWNAEYIANDMTKTSEGVWTLTKENVSLSTTETYEFKVVTNHSWDNAYPSSNKTFKVAEDGTYTITFTFQPGLSNDDPDKLTIVTNPPSIPDEPDTPTLTYTVVGGHDWLGSWDTKYIANDMTDTAGNGIYTLIKENISLSTTETYEFKVVTNHSWDIAYPSGDNMTFTVAQDGNYYITFTYKPNAATDAEKLTVVATPVTTDPDTPDEPEPSTLPDNVYLTSADEICIFYNANGQTINTNIHCYVWGGTTDNGWPGGEATDLGNGYWKFTVPANCGTPTQCIWNTGNGGSQTKNLSYTNHAIYNGETIGEIVTKIYSATPDDPEQPTTYYIKHAWGTGQDEDLSWKQLTQDTTNTTLYYVNALFGGTGCYFDTTQSGDNPPFIAQQSLELRGEPTAGDSARFVLNIKDSTITITKIIPEDPNPEPTVNYYLVGSFGKDGDETYYWDPATGMPLNDDSIILNLAAGTYSFRLLSSNTEWDQNMGYAQVNAECSSDGYLEGGNDNNIKINLTETGDVKIKVVNESICLTGSFSSEIDITSYTIVGDSTLTGYNWLTTATDNDMENESDEVWILTKNDRTLYKDIIYNYKVVGNHDYNVSQYPAGNATLSVSEDGIYNITFTYQPNLTEGDKLTAEVTKTDDLPEPPVTYYYLKHSWNGTTATWKQLTQDTTTPNLYYISDIYGGGQTYYNTDTTTGVSTLIENPTLDETLIAGDSVKFVLNISERTLTITFISHPTTPDTPDDPQPTTYRYALVTETPTSWIGKYLIGVPYGENKVRVYSGIDEPNGYHEVEVVDDTIELKTDTCMIKIDTIISKSGYGVQILTGKKAESWIHQTSNSNGTIFAEDSTAISSIGLDANNNLSIVSGVVTFKYNTSSFQYRFYKKTSGGVTLPQLYRLIEEEEPTPEPTANYYLVGSFADINWELENAKPLDEDNTITLENLPAGTYTFRLLTAAKDWNNSLGYTNIDAECSYEGYQAGPDQNNIQITLAEDRTEKDVMISVEDGKICLLGEFSEPPVVSITSYTIVGDSLLTGANWKADNVLNDMTTNEDSLVWTLTKTDVALTAGTYNYKVVANHAWNVEDYPVGLDNNATLIIGEDGIYNITFTYQPTLTEGDKLTANAERAGDIPEQPVTNYYLKHSWNGTTATWKQLTQDTTNPNLYYISDIYGGGQTYYNTDTTTGVSTLIDTPTFEGDPTVGDSVKFTLNLLDGTLTITFISRPTTPDDPQPSTKRRYQLVTQTPSSWIGEYIIGYTIDENTFRAYTGEDKVNGYYDMDIVEGVIETDTCMIKIDTIVSKSGYGVQILTGVNAGKWLYRKSSSNGCDFALDSTIVASISVNGNNVSIVSSSTTFQYNSANNQLRFRFFTSNQKLPQLYRLIEDEEPTPDDPEPTTTYTIISDNTVLFPGEAWAIDDTNDMKTDTDSSLWTLTKSGVTFSEPDTLLYKVVKNHEFGENDYPQGDLYDTLIISKSGIYTITFTYQPTLTEGDKLTATAERTGDIEPISPELDYYLKQNGDAERWIKMTKSPENDNVYYCQGIYQGVACYLSNDTTEQLTLAIEPEDFAFQNDPQVRDNVIFTIDVTDKPVKMTITKIEDVPTVNYYLIGSYGTQELTPQNALSLVNDTIIIPIPAAQITATFRLLTSSKDLEDENNLGYADVDSECSSTGYYNAGDAYNSIMITTSQAGNVMVTVKDGKICVTGAFVIRDDPQPQPTNKRRYQLVTQTPTSWVGEYVLGYRFNNDGKEILRAFPGVDAVNAYYDIPVSNNIIETDTCLIKINTASTEGYTIQILTGTNEGKWVYKSGTSNGINISDNENTVSNIELVDSNYTVKITGNSMILKYNSSTSNGQRFRFYGATNSYPLPQLYRLMDSTATDTTDIPDVQDTVYTIVGDEALTGADWKVDYAANDLTKSTDGTWTLNLTDIRLLAGTYNYKVVMNHAWNNSTDYPQQGNITLTVETAGVYNISFTYSPDADEDNLTAALVLQSTELPKEYYIKHGWVDGLKWTWEKLNADEQDTNLYFILNIYGGTGCNFNVIANDANAYWIENPRLVGNPEVGDSAIFTLNIADSTITITKLKPTPIEPPICINSEDEIVVFYNANGQTVNANIYLAFRVDSPSTDVYWLWHDIPAQELGNGYWKAIVSSDLIGSGSISQCYWMDGEDTDNKTETVTFTNHAVYNGVTIGTIISTLCPETALPEYITETSAKVRCIIENGTVYIIRNNVKYTLMGQKVK